MGIITKGFNPEVRMKKLLIVVCIIIGNIGFAAPLDEGSAKVYMTIAKFAKLKNFADLRLLPVSSDGDAGSIYTGESNFELESNTPVLVNFSGTEVSNGKTPIAVKYKLDDSDTLSFETKAGTHKGVHSISGEAQLGGISEQEAGDYIGQMILTVSAL